MQTSKETKDPTHHKFRQSHRVETLVMDSCVWNDQSCADMLRNLNDHQYLDSLTLSNCKLGKHSLDALMDILPTITELRLINPAGLNMLHLHSLVTALELKGKALQVLKLNHINLGTDTALKAINDFIEVNPFINLLDLAYCSLGAGELLTIAK